jgi:AmmeMemoRadiSam system protein A
MKDEQKQALLKTAKAAVGAAVKGQSAPRVVEGDAKAPPQGCFVTLTVGGQLRGCIGQFIAEKPLTELVGAMARAAAREDPRFFDMPIRETDFGRLHIEISALSPLSKTKDPLSLRLGTDGIYIIRGRRSGCFLPQVATETGWTKEEFLSYCCTMKANLPSDAWKDSNTEVYLFTAEIFGADYETIED